MTGIVLPPSPRVGLVARVRSYLLSCRIWRTMFPWRARRRALERIMARRLERYR